jgi:heme-degrading monooxygenase HmoA
MIARMWTTRVSEERATEYEAFAREVSLPMFRQQPGYLGVAMLRQGEDCVALTLWQDAESVAALSRSDSYVRTVNEILAAGFLRSEQNLETYTVHLLADLSRSEGTPSS